MMPMVCTARIRPFRPANDTEVQCEEYANHGGGHAGVIRNYAGHDSTTILSWVQGDRRTFHGDWPGPCEHQPDCILPAGHHGECAS